MALDLKSTGLSGGNFGAELDDYEEGSWTASFIRASTYPTLGGVVKTGNYVKVGNLVHLTGSYKWTSVSGHGSNVNILSGHPFSLSSINTSCLYVGKDETSMAAGRLKSFFDAEVANYWYATIDGPTTLNSNFNSTGYFTFAGTYTI
jgi:hypothetical protein